MTHGQTIVLIQALIQDCKDTIKYWEAQPDSVERTTIINGQKNIITGHEKRLAEVKERAENFKDDIREYIDEIKKFLETNKEYIPDYIEIWFRKILEVAETILKQL